MNSILLQVTLASDTTTTNMQESVTIIELLKNGGFMMYPIALLSIAAVYIIVERLLTIKRATKDPTKFIGKVKQLVLDGNVSEANQLCEKTNTPFSRMIQKALQRLGTPLKSIEAAIENVGKIEIYHLEKNLSFLATISGAAPMIGFLGTVTGMIQAFIAIAQQEGTASPKVLSEGIYQAMMTTAAGLAVGIIAYIGYNYLITQVQKTIHQMEYTSIEFIDLMQQPTD